MNRIGTFAIDCAPIRPSFSLKGSFWLKDDVVATDKHEQIRKRYDEIWGDDRPVGAELSHWLQASDELSPR